LVYFKKGTIIVLQVFLLSLINKVGILITDYFSIPIPGNVFGMILLFIFLSSGIVPLRWFEHGASILIKHLAFFFIPIAVGLMTFGDLFLKSGWFIITVILISAGIGIISSSYVSQITSKRREVVNEHNSYSI